MKWLTLPINWVQAHRAGEDLCLCTDWAVGVDRNFDGALRHFDCVSSNL
ncbi:hypothetical protein OHAE_5460 [Ochrobactrum soli]|uniref:Uncharacterized protein n=1 Tax=Ochrobactrum soli TaxID=2448455 RepID=A0A2P9HE68_9HYPH|nr:hypothetical protein OHAE_5460 [[Ochrobactrum] soli]